MITFIRYHYVLLKILYTRAHTKFPLQFPYFGIAPATEAFFLCFHRLAKPTTFVSAVTTKPPFTQNVFGLKLLQCIVFIADVFFLASCLKFSEYWSQAIFSQTQSWKECWNYYRPWYRGCLLPMVIKSKRNHD